MQLRTIGTYLDSGYWVISAKRAGMLTKGVGGVPRPGYEKRVVIDGDAFWITRTVHQGKVLWSIRRDAYRQEVA